MTKNQASLYWRTWAKVRQIFIDYGGFSAADADAERHHIHREAIGVDKSSAALNNRDLDAILDHFRNILVIEQGPETGPARAVEMPRRRLIWAIEKTGLSDAYINSIVTDEFHTGDWRTLPESSLAVLRFTCVARSRAKRHHPAA